jgi:putative ABC transport system permease protein
MFDDIRDAFRQLRKNPGFTAITAATLALGIGAAAAIFGLVQSVLLSPPPYADPDRLVLVRSVRTDGEPYKGGSTFGEWTAWRAAKTVEHPALYRWTFNFQVLKDGSESLGGMVVTPNFFRVVGLRPIVGREFATSELSRPKVAPTGVIIGYDLWQRKFGGSPSVIGQTLTLSRMPAPLPIVGVMPRGVRFLPDPGAASEPNYDLDAHVDFWLGVAPDESQPRARGWNAVARLRDGMSIEQVRAELAATTASLARSEPVLQGLTASVSPVRDVLNEEGRRLLVPLFGSVAILFLIACANVAGLLLARGLQRQPEYATRSALGAGRWRLIRHVLTESTVLALVGAALGAALAVAIVTVLKAIGGRAVPRADAVAVGWPVLAFGVVAALIAAGVAGLLPALRASRPDRVQSLKGSRTSAGLAERRLLGAVATIQIVLTVALMSGAALLLRTAWNLQNVRPGYDTENVLAMTVTAVQRDQYKAFHTQALERVAAIPGVTHVAFAWGVPLTGNKWPADIEIPGRTAVTTGGAEAATAEKIVEKINLPLRSITPDYFGVMGMRLVEGRPFRISDDDKAPRVAIINAAMARRYFGGQTALGRRFNFSGQADRPLEIVGIVADTRTEDLSAAAEPEIYLPFWQQSAFSKHLVLRTTREPLTMAALVRRELRAVDPTSAVEHVTTMAEIRRESTAARTFAMRLLTGFAVAATLLALVGLYGVLSLSVGARTKELAVRKAIGAQGRQIVTLVLTEGSRLILVGVVLGAIAALGVGRLLETLLFDVRPADPLALSGAALVFFLAALAACALPAFRAARVELMEALRTE